MDKKCPYLDDRDVQKRNFWWSFFQIFTLLFRGPVLRHVLVGMSYNNICTYYIIIRSNIHVYEEQPFYNRAARPFFAFYLCKKMFSRVTMGPKHLTYILYYYIMCVLCSHRMSDAQSKSQRWRRYIMLSGRAP